MSATEDAVWITGVGTATPLGLDYASVADALLAGRSGIGPVTTFDTAGQPCRVAGILPALPAPPDIDPASWSAEGPWEQLMLWCATQALRDAGGVGDCAPDRVGLILGIGSEWLLAWERDLHAGGYRVREPERDRQTLVDGLRDRLGLSGPTGTVAAACAGGNFALGMARQWIRLGVVDVCLAGACDRSISPLGMAGFGNLGALSKRNDDPERASRPFDAGRDGFVMSEGGAAFVLESSERARRRGAKVYGEIAGFGASSDAHHMVIPSPDPQPCVRAMRAALRDAAVGPGAIDYINAHATSTPAGDRFEAQVLREVLGADLGRIPISSTKSMTGHLLGATAAVEALACLATFDRGAIPPTINLDDPDPECADLRHIPHHAREADVHVAVSNSFGFGGSNTCLILRSAG